MTNISLLSLRVVKENSGRYDVNKKISCPTDIITVLNTVLDMENMAEENLVLITLDTKNNITGLFTVSTGDLSQSIVHPREVYKRAIMQNAKSIIIAHNHPSGDSTPSENDINITKRLNEAGKILGIELLDHVIIGYNNYTSLKGSGIL